MAWLKAITGPMYSGKSEKLVWFLERAVFAGSRIVLTKPCIDKRGTRETFTLVERSRILRDYKHLTMRTLDHSKELRSVVASLKPDILALDEAQFFGLEILEYLEELLEKMKSKNFIVFAAGLDLDAWRRPFGIMPALLAMADEVIKLTAVCFVCRGENGPAIFTQKKGGTGDQIQIGDIDLYEARCRVCHTIPKETPD